MMGVAEAIAEQAADSRVQQQDGGAEQLGITQKGQDAMSRILKGA